MARGIAIGIASGALIAACFSAPGRPAGTGDLDDAGVNGDGTGPDSTVTMFIPDGDVAKCTTDLFFGAGSGTCGSTGWGTLGGSGFGNLNGSTNGELELGISSGAGTEKCSSQLGAWNRITVDVQAVAASSNVERTFVGITSADETEAWGVEFVYDSSGLRTALKASCTSAALRMQVIREWDPMAQRYLQIERTDATTLTFRASPNNAVFTPVGSCTALDAAVLSSSRVRLSVEQTASTGSTSLARFGHIELCHD